MRDIGRILLVSPVALRIRSEIPLRSLVPYFDVVVVVCLETIGHAVIIGAENYGPVLSATQFHLIIPILHKSGLGRDQSRKSLIYGMAKNLQSRQVLSENSSVRQSHTNNAWLEYLFPVRHHAPGQIRSGTHLHLDVT